MEKKNTALVHYPNSKTRLELFLPTSSASETLSKPINNSARIKVKYVSLCRTDLLVHQNIIPINKPIILGHEFTGVVTSVSSNNPEKQKLIGKRVSVNPFISSEFLGVDRNGALSSYIDVPISHIYLLPAQVSLIQGVYFEPVCASMSPLKYNFKAHQTVGLYGTGRIAKLTSLILNSFNIKHTLFSDTTQSLKFDVIVETGISPSNSRQLLNMLNDNGVLIIKSRTFQPLQLDAASISSRNLTLQGLYYGEWNKALPWIATHTSSIDQLIGSIYSLDQWELAFEEALDNEKKKILIQI